MKVQGTTTTPRRRPECHHIRTWDEPSPSQIGNSVEAFLNLIGQPTALFISGKDTSRVRAMTTLLHGNEPSGLQALFQWLKHGNQPATNLFCFIGAVKTALTPPGFFYRQLPGKKDLNRCFWPESVRSQNHDSEENAIAAELVALLDYYQPECVIDVHNTSGNGPSFAVSVTADPANMEIAALFTSRMIVTDLRMGALMELSSSRMPIVTIECGGSLQEASMEMARRGLNRFLSRDIIFETGSGVAAPDDLRFFETLHNPVRIELLPDRTIEYSHYNQPSTDVTLLPSIEEDNFGVVPVNKQLGWLNGNIEHILKAINSRGDNIIRNVLEVREGKLYPARPIKMFMATTNASIARSDCMFYIVDQNGQAL